MKRFTFPWNLCWRSRWKGTLWRAALLLSVLGPGIPARLRGDDLMPLFSPVSSEDKSERSETAPPSPAPQVPSPGSVSSPTPPAPALSPSEKTATPTVRESQPALAPVPSHQPQQQWQKQQPGQQQDVPPLENSSYDLQHQKDLRFRELKRQMEILSRLPRPPAQSGSSEEAPPDHKEDSAPESELEKTEPAALPSEVPGPAHPEASPQKPGAAEHPEAPLLVHQDKTLSISAEYSPTVVEGTIDRFALATSLFGTGQTELCLDVLKHTELTQLSREDQVWAEYMQACCHRRGGRLDLAKQSYRRILAEKDADWVGQLARWWLDDLDSKAQLKTDISRLSETLSAWETEIDTLGTQATRTATHQGTSSR